jgi:hypothetical protein
VSESSVSKCALTRALFIQVLFEAGVHALFKIVFEYVELKCFFIFKNILK